MNERAVEYSFAFYRLLGSDAKEKADKKYDEIISSPEKIKEAVFCYSAASN